MSSPIVFFLTAAQCRALLRLAEGQAGDVHARTLRQLAVKGLLAGGADLTLTPSGEAAALLAARLSQANPATGGAG